MPARGPTDPAAARRYEDVLRILDEFSLGDPDLLEGWDGVDVEDLAGHLSIDDFQTLVDQLELGESASG